MSEWLRAMEPAVGNHLWQSTAFAAVAWVVTLALRKNQARVLYGVWVAASVKSLVPFSLLIAVGGMLPRPQRPVVAMPVYSAVDEVGMPFSEVESMAVAEDPAHAAMGPRHEWGTRLMHSLPAALAGLWACGVGVVLVVWCGGWVRVKRTLRRARRVESGREAEILPRVEAAMGGRRRSVTLLLSRELMEPGMFGIWRPVLIWPERLSERLDDEHIEAILAHELMHARRRDNLTASLHMIVEAAFWFHPLVWWMERRMVAEREHACDEAVVAMGNRPGVYAESLLKTCRFCVESPLVCVAGITGADLAARVRAIMTLRSDALGWWRKAALAALAVAAVAIPMAFGVVRMIPMYGQVLKATGQLPSYDVVVIKPSKDEAHGASTTGEQTQYLVTAKMLIQFAYGIYSPPKMIDLNVVGGPDWINTDVFSIEGKMDSTEFEQEQKLGRGPRHERRQLMEQSLLADRFKLKMHTEMRDEPVYALTVMKGLKLTPAKDATGSAYVNPYPSSSSPDELKRGLIVRTKGRGFEMTVKGMTLDIFADALMSQKETAGRQVVNQTGLTGAYDFTLVWGPEQTAAPENDDAEEPPLFTAIQQQLGLKLAEGKGPTEVVVIDHIERPVFDEAQAEAIPHAAAAAVLPVRLLSVGLSQEKAADVAANPVKFDVVSIKPDSSDTGILMFKNTPDGFQARGFTVQMLLRAAYGYDDALIFGAPGWLNSEHYTLDAKVSGAEVPALAKLTVDQRKLMLQPLLVDRFQLKFHRETKQLPIYSLVVAKTGVKLQQSAPSDSTEPKMRMKAGVLTCQRFSISDLAQWLTLHVGRKVVDNTGFTGAYDFTLSWTPDSPGSSLQSVDSEASIFTAIQEQLGLKLEPMKGPIETFVIDHVERPSEN
jgi:bla regulator protein blaR1